MSFHCIVFEQLWLAPLSSRYKTCVSAHCCPLWFTWNEPDTLQQAGGWNEGLNSPAGSCGSEKVLPSSGWEAEFPAFQPVFAGRGESGAYLCRCRWHTAEACSCRCCWSSDCGGWGWKLLGSWRPRCLQQGPWRGLVTWRSGKKKRAINAQANKTLNPNQRSNPQVSQIYFI